MTALLLISIGILALGIVGSLALMFRTGEIRVGLLTLCLSMLGVRQGIVLWNSWSTPLTLDKALQNANWTEASLAAAAIAALTILGALWKTLAERDQAESLHWDSMEAVRVLSELAVRWDLNLDEKLDHLLRIGCEHFGLEIGAVSRIENQRYEVIAIRAPADFSVNRGDVLLLADTLCRQALDSKRPVAFQHVPEAARPPHADRAPFEFASYLGALVSVYGEPVGTLCFGGGTARSRRFTATDKDLANLMAQWVGTELERRLITEEREANGAREAARSEKPPRAAARLSRAIDVNAAIRRSDKNLRALIGPNVEIDYRLADGLHAAARLHVTVGAIVESLTHEAIEAFGEDIRLRIATSNLEVARQNPDVVPAVAPNHYITIALTVASSGVQAESLNHAFEPAGARTDSDGRWELQKHLTIGSIYRLLQRYGGDLSLAVEPGVDATFTVYLPRAATAPAKVRKPPATGLPARIA